MFVFTDGNRIWRIDLNGSDEWARIPRIKGHLIKGPPIPIRDPSKEAMIVFSICVCHKL